jgi:hypothetical protein
MIEISLENEDRCTGGRPSVIKSAGEHIIPGNLTLQGGLPSLVGVYPRMLGVAEKSGKRREPTVWLELQRDIPYFP